MLRRIPDWTRSNGVKISIARLASTSVGRAGRVRSIDVFDSMFSVQLIVMVLNSPTNVHGRDGEGGWKVIAELMARWCATSCSLLFIFLEG